VQVAFVLKAAAFPFTSSFSFPSQLANLRLILSILLAHYKLPYPDNITQLINPLTIYQSNQNDSHR
jgi:hypothetical protein